MKLLRLSLLLILGGLGWFLSNQRRKLQSGVSEQAVEEQNSPANTHHQLTRDSPSNIDSLGATMIQPRADDDQEWRKKQEEFWNRQLSIAGEQDYCCRGYCRHRGNDHSLLYSESD